MRHAAGILGVTAVLGIVSAAMPTGFAQGARGQARPTAPKTWTDHTFTGSDGTKFHYVEQGAGTPVILLHGLGSSAVGNWFNNGAAQRIATTNRVIALDMRGHGETGPSPADTNNTMIGDIVELLDHLEIAKAHIAGYSMGGATTAGLLKMAPERFLTAGLRGIGVRETDQWRGKMPADSPATPAPGSTAARGTATGSATTPAARPAGVPTGAPRGAPVASQDVDLTKIKFPVLAINGSLDSPLTKTSRMWRELEDFTYIVIPGRSHIQTPGDPKFGEALARFIASHN
jgi:pimeloyl-ACP methyl ester carboxylesterase